MRCHIGQLADDVARTPGGVSGRVTVVAREHALDVVLAAALADVRGRRVEVTTPQRGDRRRILDMAMRNAELALGQERLRAERSREQDHAPRCGGCCDHRPQRLRLDRRRRHDGAGRHAGPRR